MKTLAEIEAALSVKYEGEILTDYEGFKYIPWNLAVQQANKIFGYAGWSDTILVHEAVADNTGAVVGYKCQARVTVTYEREDGTVGTIIHEGEGYNAANSGRMDTTVMGAPSIALSKAFKKFGDAFGLFLYEKEKEEGQKVNSSGSRPASSRSTASNGAARPVGSEKQRSALVKQGLSLEMLKRFDERNDYTTFKKLADMVFGQKLSVPDALAELGFETVPASSDYPELDY